MKAADVMTRNVISVERDTPVREIAGLLLTHRISAVPVIDANRRLLGIVSEGDLMRRIQSNSPKHRSWWLEAFSLAQSTPDEYVKAHGSKASDVMTSSVLSIGEDTPLHEVATLLEKKHIKRVPVVREGRVVGIVSRANLLHGLASQRPAPRDLVSADDSAIREKLLNEISGEIGLNAGLINVVVKGGVVQLWGVVDSDAQKKAAQIAAENIEGVKSVDNNLGFVPPWAGAY